MAARSASIEIGFVSRQILAEMSAKEAVRKLKSGRPNRKGLAEREGFYYRRYPQVTVKPTVP
jgi:hypothetical protein